MSAAGQPSPVPAGSARANRVLVTATAADSIAAGVILPALPFIVFAMGGDSFYLGAVIAAFSVAGLVGAPVWGSLADRYGTRRILLIAPLVAVSGHLMFAFSTSLVMLLASRIVVGFGSAVVLLAQTHVSLSATNDTRTALLGRVTAAQGVGTIVGPALGGLLGSHGRVTVGLVAAAGPFAAWALTLAFLPDAGPHTASGARPKRVAAAITALRSRQLRSLAIAILLGWLCFSGYAAVLPVELRAHFHLTSVTYGYIVAISGVVALIVRGVALGRLRKRFGETTLMTGGALLIAASMLLAVLIPTLWLAPLLPLTWALGASVLFPSAVSEFGRLAPRGAVGLGMAAAAILAGTGYALGPIVAGAVAQFASVKGPFYIGALLLAVVALLARRIPAEGDAGLSAESVTDAPAGVQSAGS